MNKKKDKIEKKSPTKETATPDLKKNNTFTKKKKVKKILLLE